MTALASPTGDLAAPTSCASRPALTQMLSIITLSLHAAAAYLARDALLARLVCPALDECVRLACRPAAQHHVRARQSERPRRLQADAATQQRATRHAQSSAARARSAEKGPRAVSAGASNGATRRAPHRRHMRNHASCASSAYKRGAKRALRAPDTVRAVRAARLPAGVACTLPWRTWWRP